MTTILDRLYYLLDVDLSPSKDKWKQFEAQADASMKRVAKNTDDTFKSVKWWNNAPIQKTGEELDKVTKHATNVNRELISIGRSVSSGNFSNIPFSIARISTHLFGLSSIAVGAAGAVVGIGAAFVAAGFAAEAASARIERSLRATGFAAGVTRLQVEATAAQLDRTTSLSYRGAQDALSILNAHGNISGSMQGSVAGVVPGFAALTGSTWDNAAKELERLLSDPAKASKELFDQFKLLTAGQTEQIRHLQAVGELQGAQEVLTRALNDRFGKGTEALGSFQTGLDLATKYLSDFWAGLGRIGGLFGAVIGGMTPMDQLQGLQSLRNKGLTDPAQFERNMTGGVDDKIAALEKQLGLDRETVAAKAKLAAETALIQQALPLAQSFDQLADKTKTYRENVELLSKGLEAAKDSNAPAQIVNELSRALATARLVAANQRTPGQVAAASAADAWTLAMTPTGQRQQVAAELAAAARRKENLGNVANASSAGAIYNADISNIASSRYQAGADSQTRANESADARNREAQAIERVAAAYRISAAAGAEQERVEEALKANLEDGLTDQAAYTDALRRQAAAHREISSANADQSIANEIEMTKAQLSLMGKGEDYRAKELADLRTKNQLLEEGYELGSKEFDMEFAKRAKLNEGLAATQLQLQRTTELSQGLSGAIGSALEAGIQPGAKLSDILKQLLLDVVRLIEKMYILKPLEEAISGGLSGSGVGGGGGGGLGGLISSGLSALFGGGGSTVGSDFGGGDFNIGSIMTAARGAAWSGKVRYAAKGDVLGGPTMFSSPTGPVIGGEAGDEGLLPLGRGPDGKLGVHVTGSRGGSQPIQITQVFNVHPDVNGIARQEALKLGPFFSSMAVRAMQQLQARS